MEEVGHGLRETVHTGERGPDLVAERGDELVSFSILCPPAERPPHDEHRQSRDDECHRETRHSSDVACGTALDLDDLRSPLDVGAHGRLQFGEQRKQ